jgi:3-oxoacyl-[acyl-carrier-protein] synthase II
VSRRRVVITGAGMISPLGLGRAACHDSLAAGRSGIGPISLFDASRFPTSIAAEVKGFEPARHAGLPAELARAAKDRKVGFLLAAWRMAAEEAFGGPAGAPCPPERRALSFGVGVEVFRMEDMVPCCDEKGQFDAATLAARLAGCSFLDSFRIPADLGPSLVAEFGAVRGPRRVNVGACVASAQALGEGFRLIQRGRADLVCAGGADSMITPLAVAGFGLLAATSTSNHLGARASRPFDKHRDGFVLGEGAAVLVLEERASALERGAAILAELVGYGTSMDAYRITDPAEDGSGAACSMARALTDAGLAPGDLDYINAHGTSTVKNDQVETLAIKQVFGEAARRIPISSTKSMFGHAIGAAGALELAASLCCFERDFIPPTLNLETPDPVCDLDYVPGSARPARPRLVLSNSFGFGGQNATLVMRRHDLREPEAGR